ncbi:MAG: PD-(D/E)XK nuclease family protein [Bacteroidales bacterium]|nr:PD-(D/E)XK nuclease family protein [Bacteroidales bacterium]
MDTFLQEVAQRLIHDNPDDLSRTLVVFNNRRPILFLKQELTRAMAKKAYFLPRMMSMDDMVASLGHLKILPHEFLLFELYEVHRQVGVPKTNDEPFEDFMTLGETMLGDFSAIDLYRVDAEKLFGNLHDLKAIGEWSIEEPTLTPFQKRYLEFYTSLLKYYKGLRERLCKKGKAYSGMAYREVADHIEETVQMLPYQHVYFVGFSVLSQCEKAIIQCLVRQGKATLLADGDNYYFNDLQQEAGLFLRKLQDISPEKFFFPDNFLQPKRLSIVACPEDVLQAKYAGQRLCEWLQGGDKDLQQTCVVLADESLLLPMLNSLPPTVDKANVTMGLPYTFSWLNTLVLTLMHMHRDQRDGAFYYRHVVSLLGDEHMELLTEKPLLRDKLQTYFVQNKWVYLKKEDLLLHLQSLGVKTEAIAFLFDEADASNAIACCLRLMALFAALPQTKDDAEMHETIACGLEVLNHLQTLQETYHYFSSLATLEKVYTRLSKRRNIAFFGEPLQGLQILGVLETRCLDFKRLIVLSANEGVIPSGRSVSTLIPFSLKHAYGLPTYQESDAVYAYHFYRMLQRAQDITLVYQMATDGLRNGEASRFLLQLKHELLPLHGNIVAEEHTLSVDSSVRPLESLLRVEKDDKVMEKLRELANGGFSPSALNIYRACPLRYYTNYMLDVREEREMEESFDAHELGTFVHEILHDIYDQDADGVVRVSTLKAALGDIDDMIQCKFEEKYRQGRNADGMNYYYRNVAREQISALLEKEVSLLARGDTLQMVQMEQNTKARLADGVFVKGIADRIDRLNGQLRVIDYKTGMVEAKELNYRSDTNKPASDKWFQVLTYAWLISQQRKVENETLQCGIYPLNNLRESFTPAIWDGKDLFDQTDISRFEEMLKQVVDDILNPTLPFEATPNGNCKNCPRNEICSAAMRG